MRPSDDNYYRNFVVMKNEPEAVGRTGVACKCGSTRQIITPQRTWCRRCGLTVKNA